MAIFTLLFDLTVNGGWNLCAVATYSIIGMLGIGIILERLGEKS